MASRYHGGAVQWQVKKSRKAIDQKQSGYFYTQASQLWFSVFTTQFLPMPNEFDVIALSYDCGLKPSV